MFARFGFQPIREECDGEVINKRFDPREENNVDGCDRRDALNYTLHFFLSL